MAKAPKDNPNRSVLKVGNKIIVTEVFTITPKTKAGMKRDICIDNCNAACDIPGVPAGTQVTSFYKKHV